MAQIGIKLADHSFYPVLEDDSPRRRRMVLTVAREGQQSVQVDLLRRSVEGDQLVGCLVLEDLPGAKDMELEFVLGLDGSGNIDARISDPSGAQYQSLAANLSQLDLPSAYGLPEESSDVADISGMESLDDEPLVGDPDLDMDLDMDIDMDIDMDLPDELDGEDELHASISGGLSESFPDEPAALSADTLTEDDFRDYDDTEVDSEADEPGETRNFNPVVLLALILIVLGVVMIGAYFFFTLLRGDALPELPGATAMLFSPGTYLPG